MTITVKTLGPNSAMLDVRNETALTIADAVAAWYVQHGWELHDSYLPDVGNRKIVLKALCANGINYKYVMLTFRGTYFLFEIAEAWNATAHTGTNVVSPANYVTQIDPLLTKIYLFAGPRYLSIFVFQGTSFSWPLFCNEAKHESVSSVDRTYPSFFTTSLQNYGDSANGVKPYLFPRTKLGVGNEYSYSGCLFSKNLINFRGQMYYPQMNAARDNCADSPIIHPVREETGATIQNCGRVFDLKTLPSAYGGNLDTVVVKCDAEGFSDPNGTDVEHFILANVRVRVAIPK